jgi:hypothetical protein
MRLRLGHPVDGRLHAEYGTEREGVFIELFLLGDNADEPTVRYGGSDGEPWDATPSVFWQAVNVLVVHGFVSVSEVHDAIEAIDAGAPRARLSRRLRAIAELVENLREACDGR